MQKINECKGDWMGVRNAFRQIRNGTVIQQSSKKWGQLKT